MAADASAGDGKRREKRTASASAMHACVGVFRLICVACAIDWLSGTGSTPAGLMALMAAALAAGWFVSAVRPPPPTPCGTPGGPPVTAPRARMRDGRYLAYAESGVSRDRARFKVVYSHGFSGGRMDSPRASQVGERWCGGVVVSRFDASHSFLLTFLLSRTCRKGMAHAQPHCTHHGMARCVVHMRVLPAVTNWQPLPPIAHRHRSHVGGKHQPHQQPPRARLRFVQGRTPGQRPPTPMPRLNFPVRLTATTTSVPPTRRRGRPPNFRQKQHASSTFRLGRARHGPQQRLARHVLAR